MQTKITPLRALLVLLVSGCDAGGSAPDSVTPDTTAPDTIAPDSVTPDTTAPDTIVPDTDRLPASVEFGPVDTLFTIVADLDGDGRDDLIQSTRSPARVVVKTGGPERLETELGYLPGSRDLEVAVGDLDDDGVKDLVLSAIWDHRVEVYFGPFDGVAKPRAASFHLARDPGGGLADLFGATVLVADLNLDGVDDLLVAAPGEGEEACSGTRASLVYFGPLAAGPGSTDDGTLPVGEDEDDGPAPSRVLPATPGVCLGDYAFVLPSSRGQALVLSLSREPGRVAYGLPLSAEPMPLTDENAPALPDLRDLHGRIDLDGDGLPDETAFDAELGGAAWTRSSDGAKLTLVQDSYFVRLFGVDLDGDGVGAAWILAERFNSNDYTYELVLAPVPSAATGLLAFGTLMPSWSGVRSAHHGAGVTRGDLDGDGIPEHAVGNALIRSTAVPPAQ